MKVVETYRLIGIDPGTNELGYAIIEIVGRKVRVLALDVLRLRHLESHQLKLKEIFLQIQGLIHAYHPKEMAIEAPFFGKNVQSMLKLGRAQGVAMAAAITNDVPITEYSPKQIKLAITGSGNASKEQVAAMLNNILKYNATSEYLDATDALGAAMCHFYKSSSTISGKKKYKDWSSYLKDNPQKKS